MWLTKGGAPAAFGAQHPMLSYGKTHPVAHVELGTVHSSLHAGYASFFKNETYGKIYTKVIARLGEYFNITWVEGGSKG